MKVSLAWVEFLNDKYGCAANPAPKGVDELVDRIGRQLGAIEEVEELGKKYQGIVAAKVVKCDKHPNADKLSVCLIDDDRVTPKVKRNKDGLVEVVCGAPNVAAGQMVVWIPPGATVPSTYDKDPFVLEAKELRGVVSNGMIASAKELAIGDDHQGIVVLPKTAKTGQSFAKLYHLDDYIIDIENKMFTHRPDCFGILGVARELAGIRGQMFKSPFWYKETASLPKPKGTGLKLTVKNELPKLVPRFTAVVVRDVKVQPSPLWLQSKLARVGIRPINNVVDSTNFFMYETAQPLHAYDYDKVGSTLMARKPKANETLKLLGGKTIKLRSDDIVIASNDKAIGLGGVMGGADTEVDENTRNLIIECANFDMYAVRRSSMAHGLFTDAATRFTKGQSPRQNLAVISYLVEHILRPEISGGRIASPIADIKNYSAKAPIVNTTATFINSRLGLDLTPKQMQQILTNVEFKVTVSGERLKVEPPFWRTDIEIPEDVVEEVGRLYGYDHLKSTLPIRDLTPAERNPSTDLKQQIRDSLAAGGANEVLTYSFVPSSLLQKVGQDPKNSYHLRNAISPELQYYRQTLAPSLLEKTYLNLKAGFDNFALFELGKVHLKGHVGVDKLPDEYDSLAIVTANKSESAAYFQVKEMTGYLLNRIGLYGLRYEPIKRADFKLRGIVDYYDSDRAAVIYDGEEMIGMVGELTSAIRSSFKLPAGVGVAELDMNKIERLRQPAHYQPLNRFPSLEQDLTLRSPANMSHQKLVDFISEYLSRVGGKHGYQGGIGDIDIFQKPGSSDKQTTWRLTFEHPDRTLTTQEINILLDGLAVEAKKQLKADRI